MRHVKVTQCRVADGSMTDFVNAVQQWERAALAGEDAPLHHAVLIDPDDPHQVMILTQFADRDSADRFAASGLLDRLTEHVVQCTVGSATARQYDLYYAAGEGPRAIFGEPPRT